MGQVCVKPKARVKPVSARAAAPSSSAASFASAASAASVQLAFPTTPVPTYPTQQCFRPVSITKTRTAAGTETLACDFTGAAGCFVCDVSPIQELLLHPGTKLTAPDGTVLPNPAIYDFIQSPTNGVCVKIFFEPPGKTDRENKHFLSEVASYSILKDILRDDFSLFTTYAEYTDPADATQPPQTAFTLTFAPGSQVEIDGHKTTKLHCILLRKCNKDLFTLIDTYQAIDSIKLFNDVSCMLHRLHSHGYTHGDIKPLNIVYCPNEPIHYKLIDFNLKKRSGLEGFNAFTAQYILPLLYQLVSTNNILTTPDKKSTLDMYKRLLKEQNPNYTKQELQTFISMDRLNVLLEKAYSANPNITQFLIGLSTNAYEDPKVIHALEQNNLKDLYFKSDEYAMAMVLLEVKHIYMESIYTTYATNEWPRNAIDRLVSASLYFKNAVSAEKCEAYIRSQRTKSAPKGGATSRKTNKKNPA